MKRIKAVEDGEPIPRDILSSILQVACELKRIILWQWLGYMISSTAAKESVDIEDLVDDFVTFYIAGAITSILNLTLCHTVYCAGQETTSNLLSTTMVMIHQHPDVLCRYTVYTTSLYTYS